MEEPLLLQEMPPSTHWVPGRQRQREESLKEGGKGRGAGDWGPALQRAARPHWGEIIQPILHGTSPTLTTNPRVKAQAHKTAKYKCRVKLDPIVERCLGQIA